MFEHGEIISYNFLEFSNVLENKIIFGSISLPDKTVQFKKK